MCAGRARGLAVPVLLTGREHDRVALADVLAGLAPLLHAHAALNDEELLWP